MAVHIPLSLVFRENIGRMFGWPMNAILIEGWDGTRFYPLKQDVDDTEFPEYVRGVYVSPKGMWVTPRIKVNHPMVRGRLN